MLKKRYKEEHGKLTLTMTFPDGTVRYTMTWSGTRVTVKADRHVIDAVPNASARVMGLFVKRDDENNGQMVQRVADECDRFDSLLDLLSV